MTEKTEGIIRLASQERPNKSARTQERIVASVFDLIRSGNIRPTGEEIADNAGVSIRTLFRHFSDLESLFEATREFMSQQIAVEREVAKIEGTLEERARKHAQSQGSFYEQNRNYILFYASQLRSIKETNSMRTNRAQHQKLRLWRALPEVAAANIEIQRCIETLYSFQSWDQMRFEQMLPMEACYEVISSSAVSLLKNDSGSADTA